MYNAKGLFPHETQALLEALRRDYRSEEQKSQHTSCEADVFFHRQNARNALRLLDILNPRGKDRHLHELEKSTPMQKKTYEEEVII